MSELTQVLRFSPRTIEDEMRIYRAKPIAWTDSSVVLLNEYGATLCTPDHEATPLDLPEAPGSLPRLIRKPLECSRARTRLPHLYMGGAEVIPAVAAE